MMFNYDENLFSDLYKEVHGIRPRGHEFYSATPERKQVIWDSLCEMHESEMHRIVKAERKAIQEFELRIEETIKLGAKDRETAIRWILDSEIDEGYYDINDPGYFCYLFGLPYEYSKNFENVLAS